MLRLAAAQTEIMQGGETYRIEEQANRYGRLYEKRVEFGTEKRYTNYYELQEDGNAIKNGTENTNAGFIGNINPFRYRGY